MSRSATNRILAFLWAVLFLLNSAGEGFGAHACLYHDGPAAAQSADHPPAHDHSQPADSEDGHAAPCTCLFACQASVGTALASEPAVATVAVVVEGAETAVERPETLLRRNLPHLLPFANAPPSLG